jgi:hypothetical protein
MLQLDLEGVTDTQPSYRAQIVKSLADFRREWEIHAEGNSLIDVDASVGLILSDIAERLGFSPQERHVMLGGKLAKQINSYVNEPANVKLPS